MSIATSIMIVVGLCLFETVSSIDNAVINAEVLSTMTRKGRRWFLIWGILFAVFIVRGLLPWFIVWMAMPSLGPIGALTAAFSSDPKVHEAVEASKPVLLMGGGTFLFFLFLHWLFIEPKNYGLITEKFFERKDVWFFAVASILLAVIVWFSEKNAPLVAFGATVGSAAFFISHAFKQNAERSEKNLMSEGLSDLSKIFYLEVIDATFSIDGVLGAFAFTLSVPLIIAGNGLGAIVVRQLTVGNIKRIKSYKYLKNGAMYSIACLGAVMIFEGFGVEVHEMVSPVLTFVIIGAFFWKSVRQLKREQAEQGIAPESKKKKDKNKKAKKRKLDR